MSFFVSGRAAQTVNSQQSVLFYDASSAAITDLVRHSHVKTFGLTASAEPLKAISRQLDGRRVEQLHIVAHGQRDFIVIGDAVINSDYLFNHAHLLNDWQVGEIMLWSCRVGAQGKLVQTLALLTGATVHATDKPLGMTDAGPNWALGGASGAVALPFATDAALQWPHQLVALLFSAKSYLAEDSSGASGANKANLEENSLKLTAYANVQAVKYLFVSEPPGDPIYTGNNVHGTLYAIDLNNNVVQSWVGEISRLVKSGSNVQAAQMYVYPTGTNTSNPATTLLIDLATGGSFAVGKTIGTSSDPVDTALNKLIPIAAAPVAYADNGDLQLASCVNDGDVAQSAHPTGNLITGGSDSGTASTPDSGYITSWSIDTTPNPDKLVASVSGLAVSNVKSNATGSLTAVTSASSSTVQGKYGVLTINADGSYSYDVNESNTDLIALSSANGSSLNEVFTYTVVQAGTGKTSSSTLTISIDGGNDDPTAGNDYVFVNEGTDARPVTLVSTTTTPGAVTAPNLLANDHDPDTADALHIVKAEKATSLTDETFSASAVTVTASGVSSLTRTIGFTYVTVQFGTTVSETLSSEVFVKRAGELTFTDSGTTLTAIGGSPAKQATFSAGLDLAVGDVIRFGSASATNEYTIASSGLLTASQTRFKLTGTGSTPSVGTDVTGPGVPADTKISAVNGSLVTLSHNVTLTGSGLDSGESLNFFSGAVYGNYGYLNLKSDGSYSYVLTADVPNGTTKDEFFTYQIADSNGCTDTAVLHVRIEGDQVSFPAVTAKTLTVDEVGAVSGSLAPVSGTTIALNSATGEFVSTVVSTHASTDVVVIGTLAAASPSQPVQGKYGVLSVSALGEWSYVLDNDSATVDALRTTADTLTESFEYRVQNSSGDDNVSTIVITIRGANDAPVAANDSGSAIEAGGQANATAGADASGALFVNDTDVDSGDSKTLQGFGLSSIGGLGTANGDGEYTLAGSHGTLYVKADGTWRYVVDNSDTAVDALGTGDTLTDTFQYRVADTAGATDDATLQVTIRGANDTVAVNDVEVNEASSHAVFTVTGSAGQEVTLHLAQTGAGVEEATIGDTADVGATLTTGLEYYNGSQWVPYNSTSDKITLDENGTLYVRTAIHDDDLHEVQESFQLYVTTTDGHSSVGTGVIVDEGNGVKVVFDPETGLPSSTTDGLDDDRAITVTGDTYNEGSPVAVFTVEATKGQSFTLDVQDAADTGKDATGDDSDLDVNDGDASGDALDASDIYYSIDNGAHWIKYTSGDKVTAGDYPVLVSVDISNETDDVYEGEEQFKLVVTTAGKDYSGYSSIVDDGSGKIPAVDGNGHPLVDVNGDLTLDTEATPDDDRGITVTGDTYNEGSPVAVFTVEATKGQSFTLDVQDAADTGKDATGDDSDLDANDGDASGDALDASDIYYSLDNGAHWIKYTSGDKVTAGDYPVLVSVDISNETDDVYEGEEQFKLVVTTAGKDYSAYSSIVDDGSGKILAVDGSGHPLLDNGNLTLDTETTKDDDRAITVTGDTYNEGAPVAVFTVEATKGQSFTLDVQDAADTGKDATGDDSDLDANDGDASGDALDAADIYYSIDNGVSWIKYTSGDKVTAGDYPVLVSVDISNETDDVYEGEEQFKLIVSAAGKDYSGYSSIVDDGSGKIPAVDGNGHPLIDNGTLTLDTETAKDDDRGIVVTGDTYNEGAPLAVFTVGAAKGQSFTLDVQDAADTGKDATGDDSDLDVNDGDASGDALDAADIYYSLDNGVSWIKYTSGDKVTAGDYPVLVSVDISNETDDVYEGEEQFKLIVNADGKDYSGYSSIVDDGSGKIPAVDGNGHPLVDNGNLTLDTETAKDDDRGITVTGDTYNEGSPVAVFTVEATKGQSFTLDVQDAADTGKDATGDDSDLDANDGDASGDALDAADIYYSLDNGVSWIKYTSGDKVTAGDYPVLVSVDISNEGDDVYEGEEQFKLIVSTPDKDYSGYSSIVDDGSGKIPAVDGNGHPVVDNGTLTLDTETTKDDDRAITVTGDTYNEGAPVAVFTVEATKGQSFTLDVQDAADTGKDATGDDSDLDANDGDASGDALDAADIYYSLDNGVSWIKYTSGDKVTAGDYPVLVSVDISNETDDVYEGEEQFKLIVSAAGKDYSGYSSIVDDGSGKIPAVDGSGHPLVDNGTLTLDTETAKDDDRGIVVTGDTYNEGAPLAVFTVEAAKGQSFTLDVQDAADTGKDATGDDSDLDADDGDASGDALDAADIYYSLDNGVSWIKYTSGDKVTAGDYPVLVSVDISNETDDVYEGEEQFKLIVNSDGKDYSGYSSIVDDGSGKIPAVDGNGHPLVDNGNLTLDTETAKDDDRGIVVTGGTFNEGSPRAVFSVTATEGQSLTLDVRDIAGDGKDPTGPDSAPNDQDGDDTGDALDSANIYYSLDGGQTWSLYTGEPVTAGAVPVLVAVDISNETDNVYEGEEQFQLVVTAGDKSYSGHASIIDDGTGNIAPAIVDGTDLGGSPYTGGDLGGAKDDDRPVEPPPETKPFTADLDPATDTGDFDHITQNTEPEFTLVGGDYLQPGGSVQLLDRHGNVLDTAPVTADDIARGTINLAPGFLDDGVYTYTARILDANGQLLAEAPVNVTVVTDLDGVMPSVELAANGGDFNHDGVLDWLQNNVAQLPVASYEAFAAGKAAPASSFGAIMVGNLSGSAPGSAVHLDAGAQLLDVHIDMPSKPLPEKYLAETPLMDFTVRAAEGGQLSDIAPDRAGLQTRVVIDLQPGGALANTYLKWDAAAQEYYEFLDDGDLSTYDDGATLIDLNGDKLIDRIVVTLTDGAHGDEDGLVNGIIVDPGLLAMKASAPVYSVLLKNGDRIYTTSAAEAAQMAKGTANKFEGARFDNQEGDGAKQMVAWYNPYTRDWFFGAEDQSPPYACYVRKSTVSGFSAAPAGTDGAEDFHLFVNKKGMTQLVTLEQAAELKLSALRYVDKGVAFTASTEDAYTFDAEGYLIANHGNASVQALVTTLAGKFSSTAAAGFVEAVEQHFLAQAQLVGLPHGDAASAADLNAIFGTHFSG